MQDLELDEFAKEYLRLGLRIGKHINGYVECYYGPTEIKQAVNMEKPKSPKLLLSDCNNLLNLLTKQGFKDNRKNYFRKTLNAIETLLKKLNGDKISYIEFVTNLFDFKPKFYDENYFFSLKSEADEIYSGKGLLHERMNNYAIKRNISKEKIKEFFTKAIMVAQEQTKGIFHDLLPENENVTVNVIKDQSWGMYNWYQGNFQSKIDINISANYYWTDILSFACHEGYPGHHTEYVVKEKLLFRKKNYFENSIKMLYTPEMVISEGIGQIAENVLFLPKQSILISLENFCLHPEIEDDLELLIKQIQLKKKFRVLEGALAYYKYNNNWNDNEIREFLRQLELITEPAITSMLKFISDELWAPYVLSYQGERLLTEKFGNHPNPEYFQTVYLENTLPSDLSRR